MKCFNCNKEHNDKCLKICKECKEFFDAMIQSRNSEEDKEDYIDEVCFKCNRASDCDYASNKNTRCLKKGV